jgi:hypothetical protein
VAYVDGDYRVTIAGTFGLAETWSNTWTVLDDAGGLDIATAIPAFRGFYIDLQDLMSDIWAARTATSRNLFTGATRDHAFADFGGPGTGEPLPNQLAVRISLRSGLGVNGGPFISGWNSSVLSGDGTVSAAAKATIVGAVTALDDTLDAAGWRLMIDRPTVPETVTASEARVGERFDVIRGRARDVPELYSSIVLFP